jgi:hypothetical protein
MLGSILLIVPAAFGASATRDLSFGLMLIPGAVLLWNSWFYLLNRHGAWDLFLGWWQRLGASDMILLGTFVPRSFRSTGTAGSAFLRAAMSINLFVAGTALVVFAVLGMLGVLT